MNKGHPRERQHMVFINQWSLIGDYIVLFNQGLMKCGLYLQGGLCSDVAFNTCLTVYWRRRSSVMISYSVYLLLIFFEEHISRLLLHLKYCTNIYLNILVSLDKRIH